MFKLYIIRLLSVYFLVKHYGFKMQENDISRQIPNVMTP